MNMMTTVTLAALAVLCTVASARNVDKCSLEPKTGPCRANFKRWFFNEKLQKCDTFTWGGCRGVVPFKTEKECVSAHCAEPCKQRPDPGPCKALIPSWYFDQSSKKCTEFSWGGCFGIRPFETLAACEKAMCNKKPKAKCDLTREDVLAPLGPITCQAAWTSWYFNKQSGECESFFYSACSHLGPFETKAECQNAKCECSVRPSDVPNSACDAYWTTWFYNEHSGECDKFSYSGCASVGFNSERECSATCAHE